MFGPASHLGMFPGDDLGGKGIEELLNGPFGEARPNALHDPELIRRDLVEDTRLLVLVGHGPEQRVQLMSFVLHGLVGSNILRRSLLLGSIAARPCRRLRSVAQKAGSDIDHLLSEFLGRKHLEDGLHDRRVEHVVTPWPCGRL